MFSNKKQKTKRPHGRFDTLISAKTRVEGDIHFNGGLHIDGRVKGSVIAEEQAESALLRLSECGEVEGDIVAPNIVINGSVKGDVYAWAHLELAEKAAITGNVFYNLIEMEAGASVNGKMIHSKDTENPRRLTGPGKTEPMDSEGGDLPEESPGEPGAISLDERKAAGGKSD